jgi:hypothetical protein
VQLPSVADHTKPPEEVNGIQQAVVVPPPGNTQVRWGYTAKMTAANDHNTISTICSLQHHDTTRSQPKPVAF